jgi:hypothetical protein
MKNIPPDDPDPWLGDPDVIEEFGRHTQPLNRRNIGRWRGLDRVSCELANDLVAAVAIRNTMVNGKKQFLVNIMISPPATKVIPLSSREKSDGETSNDEVKQTSRNIKAHKLAK